MGGGNFNFRSYNAQAAAASERSFDAGFTAESMCDEFNPAKVSTRFSKKGPFNGFRNVITALIGLDVTGSMGDIPRELLKGKLGSLMADLKKTYNRPNENLQISFAGIGDAKNDDAPLQVTHFESDNRFAQQLQKIWLEGHGGGNGAESYNILWWYAANKTQLNYVMEEVRKGVLITVGDDNVHPNLTAGEIRKHLDPNYEGGDISNTMLLAAAHEQYDIYHIVVTDGQSYLHDMLAGKSKTKDQQKAEVAQWKGLLGDANVILATSAGVAEAIANIIKRHRPIVKADMTNLTDEEWDRKNKETLTDNQWIEVLSYAVCPLTSEFMKQPGSWNSSKRAYEKEHVINHVRKLGTDPLTEQPLTLAKLNFQLNSSIAQLCSDYKPFFDALPESRRKHLVELALVQIKADDKSVNNSAPRAAASSSSASGAAVTSSTVAVASAAPSNSANSDGASAALPASILAFFGHKPSAAAPPASSTTVLNKDSDGINHRYKCPLSLDVMVDPVFAQDGYTYERAFITKWFEKNSTSPKTNETIGKVLTPNNDLRSEIMEWQEAQKRAAQFSNRGQK